MSKLKVMSAPSIRRLPSYLLVAREIQEEGQEYLSATYVANRLGFEPIQVRKDLAITGISGRPKKGYPVKELVATIEHFLRWDEEHRAIVVGAGNLGSALIGYSGFTTHGLRFVAAFDSNPAKAGQQIHGVPVLPMDELAGRVVDLKVSLALLTVPRDKAQDLTDRLVAAGITAIWNFTNCKVKAPDSVVVQNEDLSSGFAMLSVKRRLVEIG
ncbi:MAG: redox-sensing transcriptional repressor Rex [Spirochaetes bacterium GWD1_61_31]|nr:MAG: redox-sensing transcriptional repressor Rex [Spirochaetes bacterium GWB1_60_80]OHD34776.1 MAG: redox-sensing transcriptional repressor Rex [Spirochaetes bacterium GWC1_61_12]OHD41714.1 MAG: redox-sensing transcriptional repressor Rex [Spirochaetes bacterium GWD1_61_31]OHD44620.1 MAG: redox-sensing transcriptional repressor Rex [Spirochaetes bacterium GWE1_60_18]OHD57944.1 MAG: redox-sensing transcriptional repressor Rex [Spirochaetes bacterium GWF1_60_12]HAP43929.1 redox-sensing transc